MAGLHCPNCAAPLRDEGFGNSATCPFCNTTFAVARPVVAAAAAPHPERRAALESERQHLQRAIAQWDERLRRAGSISIGDFLLPPVLGFAFALPPFLAILSYLMRHVHEFAAGRDDEPWRMMLLGCCALFVITGALTIFLRHGRRTRRAGDAARERDAAIGPLMLRLREVEGELRALP